MSERVDTVLKRENLTREFVKPKTSHIILPRARHANGKLLEFPGLAAMTLSLDFC